MTFKELNLHFHVPDFLMNNGKLQISVLFLARVAVVLNGGLLELLVLIFPWRVLFSCHLPHFRNT